MIHSPTDIPTDNPTDGIVCTMPHSTDFQVSLQTDEPAKSAFFLVFLFFLVLVFFFGLFVHCMTVTPCLQLRRNNKGSKGTGSYCHDMIVKSMSPAQTQQ